MRILPPVACLLMAVHVLAQSYNSKSSGPFAKWEHGLSVADPTCGLDRTQVYRRISASSPVVPTPWPGRDPDYRIASIVGPAAAAVIDIDAMSIGHDHILVDSTGVLVPPPPPHWAAITFSVTRATTGAFGPVLTESTASDGAAGDLFSWHVQTGPRGIVGKLHLAQDGPDLRTFCGGQVGDLDAHDLHMAAHVAVAPIAALVATPDVFYFSISSATVAAAPASWWGSDGPSGATILATTWTGSAWTPVRPLYTWRQLGLTQNDDIDALATEQQEILQPFANWLVFSLRSALPDPLLIYSPLPVIGPRTLLVQTATGTEPVSRRLGLRGGGTDDVDAVCVLDPGDLVAHPFVSFMGGNPASELLPTPWVPTGTVTSASFREATGVRLYLNGCPPGGCAGIAALFLSPAGGFSLDLISMLPIAGTNSLDLVVPWTAPVLFGIAVDLRWVVVGPTFAIDSADPLQVRF